MNYDEPPLTESEALAFLKACWHSLGIEIDIDVLDDPLSAEFVIEDVLDAEIIG